MTDENGRPRIVLVNRGFIKRTDGCLLIVKRSPSDKHNPNLWEAPGGKIDVGQGLSQSLVREILEETGLNVRLTQDIAYFHDYSIEDGRYKGYRYVALYHLAFTDEEEVVLSEEHVDYSWVRHYELPLYDLTNGARKASTAMKYILV